MRQPQSLRAASPMDCRQDQNNEQGKDNPHRRRGLEVVTFFE